jgi:NAD+ synthase
MNYLPKIDPQQETAKIVSFLKQTFAAQKKDRVVIGISGGIDSAVVLYLLSLSLPRENIIPVHLPFFREEFRQKEMLIKLSGIPEKNFVTFSIKSAVEEAVRTLGLAMNSQDDAMQIRMGNIMVRTRMIFLFDMAKKMNALVCGTENKSERLLGYFTRYGDAASDIEPITHLYKTQVYVLARYLKIPQEIIDTPPSAGLWSGQTDEGQLGFAYAEADQVLYLYFDKKYALEKIMSLGFVNAQKVINHAQTNSFKQNVPYHL